LGLGTYTRVEIVGDPFAPLVVADFKVNRAQEGKRGAMPQWLAKRLRNLMVPRPAIDAALCTRCGTCIKVCPITPKVVDFRGVRGQERPTQPPSYDYSRCIRCYCCQEMCPESAIHVETPTLGRLLHR
ncbi:MAG: 4Fe-4S binding protein, partial [Candidatus Hydrogenedentes bacterium]|nr:4Fe-4S binding protein [Candidatus Hydrogenedentota bacterium]